MTYLLGIYVILGCIICWKNNLKSALPYLSTYLLFQFLFILFHYENEISFIYFISLSLQFLIFGFFSQSFPKSFSIIQKEKERVFLGIIAVLGGALFFGLLFHFFNYFQLEKINLDIPLSSGVIKYGTVVISSILILMITLDQTIKGGNKWRK